MEVSTTSPEIEAKREKRQSWQKEWDLYESGKQSRKVILSKFSSANSNDQRALREVKWGHGEYAGGGSIRISEGSADAQKNRPTEDTPPTSGRGAERRGGGTSKEHREKQGELQKNNEVGEMPGDNPLQRGLGPFAEKLIAIRSPLLSDKQTLSNRMREDVMNGPGA